MVHNRYIFFFEQTKALQVSINKLQEDLVGLYDWSNNKIDGIQEEVTFNSQMLNYFKQHAKILPK
jgi:hypothetical protein